MKLLLFTVAVCFAVSLSSQSTPGPVQPVQQLIPVMHQMFLEKPVQKIDRLEYRDTGEPLEHQLSPDGRNIIIKDYDGSSPVSILVTHMDGSRTTLVKSRCQIDAYVPEL